MTASVPAFVTPADLHAVLEQPDVVVLDVCSSTDGGGPEVFAAGHIPGARYSDYAKAGWRIKKDGAGGLLPTPEALSKLLGGLGLRASDHVILTPAGTNASDFAAAARVYWTLKLARQARVSILDGGIMAWKSAGFTLEMGPGQPVISTEYPVSLRSDLRVEADDVLAALGTATLVDARSIRYFEGLEKAGDARIAGRIPGALMRDYVQAFDIETGCLRPKAELEALFSGVEGDIISYCNTGHTAALTWFALSQVLGRKTRLYDGSMTEWTTDAARPVATGPV